MHVPSNQMIDDQKPYMKLGNTFTPTKTCTPRESSFIIIAKVDLNLMIHKIFLPKTYSVIHTRRKTYMDLLKDKRELCMWFLIEFGVTANHLDYAEMKLLGCDIKVGPLACHQRQLGLPLSLTPPILPCVYIL